MKLHEIRAAIEEYDKVKGDDPMSWWETTVRELLPIAEAAAELRYDISFVDEHSKCVSCGTRFDKPHASNCTVRRLQDTLDRLEE